VRENWAGKAVGGDAQIFIGEHRRMEEFIQRLKKLHPRRKGRERAGARTAIEIFYQEAMFRWLVEHHGEREGQILYPTLDRDTSPQKRVDILKKCF
jgi:hypothetical protein